MEVEMAVSPTAALAAKRFDAPDEVRTFTNGKGQAEVVTVGGVTIGRATFERGWRWSENVKPLAGTDTCQAHHTGYIVSGRMGVRMESGEELEIGPGEAYVIPPGHDAWTVGDEPCVTVDFTGMQTYAVAS
jgi:hypothetical protein